MISRINESSRVDQGARWVFALILLASVPLLMYWGRSHWFISDDWDFFAWRNADDMSDLLRGHYKHWTTIPILIYRALFAAIGIHYYWPYQLVLVSLHLTVAFLLRVIFCRSGVQPNLATIGAAFFIFFSPGSDNILSAFQMTLVGALALGLAQIILVDHKGPVDRRDVYGLCAGLGALMFSGVAVPLIAAVGLAALVRRGWRVASLHTVPLALVYLAWSAWSPPSTYFGIFRLAPTFGMFCSYVESAALTILEGIGFVPAAGILVLLLVIGGTIQGLRSDRRNLVVPGALAFGGLVFVFLLAWLRSGAIPEGHSYMSNIINLMTQDSQIFSGRYLYIAVALLLPLIMVAFQALADTWPRFRAAYAMLLVLAIAVHIKQFMGIPSKMGSRDDKTRRAILIVPALPNVNQVPRWARPVSKIEGYVTVGWLLDNADKIPVITPKPAEGAFALHFMQQQQAPSS